MTAEGYHNYEQQEVLLLGLAFASFTRAIRPSSGGSSRRDGATMFESHRCQEDLCRHFGNRSPRLSRRQFPPASVPRPLMELPSTQQ